MDTIRIRSRENKDFTNHPFKGKAIVMVHDNGYFYYIIYGRKQAGCGYITEYNYDDVSKRFDAGSMNYYSIYGVVIKNCKGEQSP